MNKLVWKTVVRRTLGEEASAGFDDAFGGVELFVLACFLVFWAWDWSLEGWQRTS